jgi:Flp pilus assembly protein CpaB
MRTRVLLAGALVLGFAGTAFADSFYVTENPTTHHCTVTTEKPADKTVVTQIGPMSFATREEAENRIKQTKVCEDGTVGSSSNSTTVIKQK